MAISKLKKRRKIRYRIRQKIQGISTRPRLSVYRSNKQIYCQLIDDLNGRTLAAAGSTEDGIDGGQSKIEQANAVGKLIAERAKAAQIDQVVFDRSGFLFHGRVKALADGAREGGLNF